MNNGSQQILDSFEQLTETEKQQVAVEILRRTANLEISLSDEALALNAEALFLSLDKSEYEHEHQHSEPR
jgi:hypothetical protein